MDNRKFLSKTPLFFVSLVLLILLCCSCGHKPKVATSNNSSVESGAPVPAYLFRFVVYGDTRSDPMHGDAPYQVHQDIVSKVTTFSPSLVLQTGDLVYRGTDAGEWKRFDEITGEMRKKIAFYPARGNHDTEPEGDSFQKRITEPILSGNKLYYSFEKDNVHFIAIDTEESLGESDTEYQWLQEDMRKARAAGRVIVPFLHRALFSIGIHGSDPVLQASLHPLFLKYGVKLVFQGHDHIYYHTVRDGITYVVTGGGGAPLYDDRNRAQGIEGDVFEKAHHFCVADVYRDRIEVTVYRQNLTKIESFSVPTRGEPETANTAVKSEK